MIKIAYIWWLVALILGAAAFFDLRAKRWGNALFWAIMAVAFAAGDAILAANKAGNRLPVQLMGIGVVVLALLAGSGAMRRKALSDDNAAQREANAARLGHKLFAPALMVPLVTSLLLLAAPYLAFGQWSLLPPQATIPALALGCCIAVIAALQVTRSRPAQALHESSRLLDQLSWAVVLPMLLAALGGVFESPAIASSPNSCRPASACRCAGCARRSGVMRRY